MSTAPSKTGAPPTTVVPSTTVVAPKVVPAKTVAPGKSVASSPSPSWAEPQIASLVTSGVLASSVADFRPSDPLTRGELADALTALGYTAKAPSQPQRLVTVRELDAQLVHALGLISLSRTIRLAASAANLAPRAYVGTETVARVLGLRVNHPEGHDELELEPKQPATRAEAAYSLATMKQLQPWQVDNLRVAVGRFAVPQLLASQRDVLSEALSFVGMPYVWAGTSERAQLLFGKTLPGGFDCSGFVWRVYKLQTYDGAPLLASVIKGRTTFAMSGEVKKGARISFDRLEPGDVLFFGDKGAQSSPTQVGHAGIYIGNGWFVHSSGNGVTLQPLEGWYVDRFAWARRPLAEAGLAV